MVKPGLGADFGTLDLRVGNRTIGVRAEIINVFNFADLRGPSVAFGDASFGQIREAAGFPRLLQLYTQLLWSTRLPPEFRLTPTDATHLLETEVFARMAVRDLPATHRAAMLQSAALDGTTGGRIYDTHIADIARAAGASIIVTDNCRHFLASLRHGIRVETPAQAGRMQVFTHSDRWPTST